MMFTSNINNAMINCEVVLDKTKSTNKLYFDKKLKQFTNAVKKCGVLEEVRIRRSFLKPSAKRKIAAKLSAQKWKYYN